jgi:hypothetical protein
MIAETILSENRPRFGVLLLALALGAAGAGLYWAVKIKPLAAVAERRYQSHLALMRLYDLQLAYRAERGTYADGLDAILMFAPDGVQLREQLKASVDLNTVAVVGDRDRFRLEVNILDPERTSVKLRGPLGRR